MTKRKTTVLVIHGGHAYPSHSDFLDHLRITDVDVERMKPRNDWKFNLQADLTDACEVLAPRMPTSDDAQYEEWELWFGRIMEVLDRPIALVGHSLGAMFLVKYYTEHVPTHPIHGMFLVAPRCDVHDRDLYPHTSFTLTEDASVLIERAQNVVFFHSVDDPVVPFESFEEYRRRVPDAEFVAFEDRGHFVDGSFPELVHAVRDTVGQNTQA